MRIKTINIKREGYTRRSRSPCSDPSPPLFGPRKASPPGDTWSTTRTKSSGIWMVRNTIKVFFISYSWYTCRKNTIDSFHVLLICPLLIGVRSSLLRWLWIKYSISYQPLIKYQENFTIPLWAFRIPCVSSSRIFRSLLPSAALFHPIPLVSLPPIYFLSSQNKSYISNQSKECNMHLIEQGSDFKTWKYYQLIFCWLWFNFLPKIINKSSELWSRFSFFLGFLRRLVFLCGLLPWVLLLHLNFLNKILMMRLIYLNFIGKKFLWDLDS